MALRSRKSRGRSLPPSRGARGGLPPPRLSPPSHGPDFRGGKVAVCVWCRPAAAAAGQECAQVPNRPSAPVPSVRGRARQLRGERPVRVPVGQRVAGRLCTAVAPRCHRVGPLHVTRVSGPNAHACPPGTTGRLKPVSPSGPGRGLGAGFGDAQASRASASSGQGREGPGPGELRVQSPSAVRGESSSSREPGRGPAATGRTSGPPPSRPPSRELRASTRLPPPQNAMPV